jgi:hypothetical protein
MASHDRRASPPEPPTATILRTIQQAIAGFLPHLAVARGLSPAISASMPLLPICYRGRTVRTLGNSGQAALCGPAMRGRPEGYWAPQLRPDKGP